MSQGIQRTTEDADEDVIVSVRNTDVRFEMDRGTSRVVKDVDLDVIDGEILGVAGESGSGKSMFASSMLDAVVEPGITTGDITYYPPSGEEVEVLDLGEEELRSLRWEQIAMVFQGALSSFNPTLSIRGHFLETLDAHGYDREEGMERAHQLLSDLNLDSVRVLDSYPHELSGGMKQRALIALALVLEPNVLVLDEPTASLDLLMQRAIISLISDLREAYDVTMVFITHDLALLTEVADRLAIMYAFEFVEVAPTSRVLTNASHPYTRLLLKATPNIEAPVDEMGPIPGSSPDPVNVPAGCSFHDRCPLADERCEVDDPDLMEVSGDADHSAACFYADQAADAVPNTWLEEEVR